MLMTSLVTITMPGEISNYVKSPEKKHKRN